MNIYKQFLVIFAILMVKITCNPISKDEEAKLASDANLAFEANSTNLESVMPDNYQSLNKRSFESEPSYQKETTNAKDTSDSKYFAQRLNPTIFKFDLSIDKNQTNYEEKSDTVTTEEMSTNTNIKHQSRNLKYYKTKDPKQYGTSSENEKIASSNNKHENVLMKTLNKKLKPYENFRYFLQNLNRYEHFFYEEIKLLGPIKDEIQAPLKEIDKYYFRTLVELGIGPFHLGKPVNPQITESIDIIYKELVTLISIDIQSNIIPIVFYQTVTPVIKGKLFPFLEKPNIMKMVSKFDKRYKFLGLFKLLDESIGLPKDFNNDYTISNFFRLFDQSFADISIIIDNEANRKLAKLYKKKIERILELLDKDWKENDAPVNFIKYIKESMNGRILILYRTLKRDLIQKLKNPDRLSENDIVHYLKALESSGRDEL